MPLTFWFEFPFFRRYREYLKGAVVFQVFILVLSAMVLDDGGLCQFMLGAAAIYWVMVVIIMVRRDRWATRGDRFLLLWGYFVAMGLVLGVGRVVPVGLLRDVSRHM